MIKTILIALTFILSLQARSLAANYAYSLKFSTNEADQVVRFDADRDEIVARVESSEDSGWNNFLVDEKGGCFIASYRKDIFYGRDIFYYDPETGKVGHFANLGEIFGPSDMALTEDELIVHVMGYSGDMSQSDGVLFIDRKSKKIKAEIYIPKGDYLQASVNGMYFDGNKYLVLSSFYSPPRMDDLDEWRQLEYTGDLFVIDTMQKKIIKTIKVPRIYKNIYGVCIVGDKIYAASAYKGRTDSNGDNPINNEVMVFSLSSGGLIKTIRVDGFPLLLVHDREGRKIYVLHRNERVQHSSIEAIDTDTDKVIGSITIPNQLMGAMVAPHKMYVSAGNAQFEHRNIPSKLYVVDTDTNKIIKEFEGGYTGISIDQRY